MILTIDQQIARMAAVWPQWSVRRLGSDGAEWIGDLQPNVIEYRLRIRYRVRSVLENVTVFDVQPRVFVDSPTLVRRPGNREGVLPHVYWPAGKTTGEPSLCLFDTKAGEWSSCDAIADTTVPWAALWLNWYEGWRITGKWLGSGKHERPNRPEGAYEPKQREDETVSRNAA